MTLLNQQDLKAQYKEATLNKQVSTRFTILTFRGPGTMFILMNNLTIQLQLILIFFKDCTFTAQIKSIHSKKSYVISLN